MLNLKLIAALCFTALIYHLLSTRIRTRGDKGVSVDDDVVCSDICTRNFTISYVHMPPFSMHPLIEPKVKEYCGSCPTTFKVNTLPGRIELPSSSIWNSSDFIYPYLGGSTADSLFGFHFVPIVSIPTAFYITRKPEGYTIRLIRSCIQSTPQIVIAFLIAMICRKLNKVIDSWINEKKYPKSPCNDTKRTPANIQVYYIARLFFVISMYSVVVFYINSEIGKVNNPAIPVMSQAKVGTLRYRKFDAILIAKHGGKAIESEGYDFHLDILMLTTMLRNKSLDGILLDKYTLLHVEHGFTWMQKLHKDKRDNDLYNIDVMKTIDFFMNDTIRSEKSYDGDQLSCGVLLKNNGYRVYFGDANKDKPRDKEIYRSIDMKELIPGFGTLWACFILGLIYEYARKKLFVCRKLSMTCLDRSLSKISVSLKNYHDEH